MDKDKLFDTINTTLLSLFFTIAGGTLAWWCFTTYSFFGAIFVFIAIASVSMLLLSPVIGIGIPLLSMAIELIILLFRAILNLCCASANNNKR